MQVLKVLEEIFIDVLFWYKKFKIEIQKV